MGYWCVCRSEPQRELTAARFLGVAGHEVYLPRIRETRVSRGRRIVTTQSLFSNYLFARIELQWRSARWSVGVSALIMSGESPAPVPDELIAELRSRERDGLIELPTAERFEAGDVVRITSGVFKGLSGLVAGMRPQERVELLLSALGRMTLPAADVEAVR
jgi:transcriptional antiterminator RfaH